MLRWIYTRVRWPFWAALGLVCFGGIGTLFDWNKSEWASWVQAIGSIGAILAAAFIATWQIDATRKSAQAERRRKAAVMVEAVTALVRSHLQELESISALVDRHKHYETRRRMERLDPTEVFATIERAAQGIPLHDLPDAEMIRLLVDLQNHIRTNREAIAAVKDLFMKDESDWVAVEVPLGPNVEALRELLRKAEQASDRTARIE